MNSFLLYCIHGIPGDTGDFDVVGQGLAGTEFLASGSSAAEMRTFNMEAEVSLDRLTGRLAKNIEHQKPDVIMAYSWGAYLVLKTFEMHPKAFEGRKVFFINPTILLTEKLGFVSKLLARSSVLARVVFLLLSKNLARKHLAKSIAPGKVDDALWQRLFVRYQGSRLWWLALKRKQLMSKFPLKKLSCEIEKASLDVLGWIVGEKDLSVPYEPQLKVAALAGINTAQVKVVAGAGHGLLWTNANEIIEATLSGQQKT